MSDNERHNKKGKKKGEKIMPRMNTRWFQEQLTKRDLTQRSLARALDRHPSAISNAFKGKRKITLDEATELARILGVPLNDVLLNAGIKTAGAIITNTKDVVDISGWVDGKMKVHWGVPKTGPKTAQRPALAPKNVNVVRYQTAGTGLDTLDGVLAYYLETKETTGVGENVGKLCVVRAVPVSAASGTIEKGEYWYLATVKRGYAAGAYTLVGLDGKTVAEDAVVEQAWPVIWIKM
jgi:transcriptional regulator with XRE-family HTH domain